MDRNQGVDRAALFPRGSVGEKSVFLNFHLLEVATFLDASLTSVIEAATASQGFLVSHHSDLVSAVASPLTLLSPLSLFKDSFDYTRLN